MFFAETADVRCGGVWPAGRAAAPINLSAVPRATVNNLSPPRSACSAESSSSETLRLFLKRLSADWWGAGGAEVRDFGGPLRLFTGCVPFRVCRLITWCRLRCYEPRRKPNCATSALQAGGTTDSGPRSFNPSGRTARWRRPRRFRRRERYSPTPGGASRQCGSP